MSYKDLTGVLLSNADLRRAKLTGSKLHGAELGRARLDEAELTCVLAVTASFEGAELFQAILANISFLGSDLTNAKLGGANLYGADLTNTDLSDADIRRATLESAELRNTKLKDAQFVQADVLDALWQPIDLPEVKTMSSVAHLSTIRLDPTGPDPGAMTRLVTALREAGLEERAKEAASARERAITSLDLAKWRKDSDVIALGWGIFRTAVGWLTDWGLSLTRGVLAALVFTLLFVPVYYAWGFSRDPHRKTGIVRISPENTLVPGPAGDMLTKAAEVERIAPTNWGSRLFWAVCFAAVTAIRSGIGPFNVLEALERLFGWKVMGITGWLGRVANMQAFFSLLLIGCLVYAYFL